MDVLVRGPSARHSRCVFHWPRVPRNVLFSVCSVSPKAHPLCNQSADLSLAQMHEYEGLWLRWGEDWLNTSRYMSISCPVETVLRLLWFGKKLNEGLLDL